MATRQVTLELTAEQEETVKALFGHNNWDYKEIKTKTGEKRQRKSSCKRNDFFQQPNQRDPKKAHDRDWQPEGAAPELNDEECMHCFLSPCVTLRNHAWVGQGQSACDQNSAIRREKYSKYWKIMTCLSAWTDPRYLQVKQNRANGGEWAITHRREVMPMCVLQQLRTLYPNPKGKPYMDHKWE